MTYMTAWVYVLYRVDDIYQGNHRESFFSEYLQVVFSFLILFIYLFIQSCITAQLY